MGYTVGYIFISVFIAAIDIIVAIIAYMDKSRKGIYLCFAGICAAVVAATHLITALADDYFIKSLFNSFYLISISTLLNICVMFAFAFTRRKIRKSTMILMYISLGYMIFEWSIFLINPFKEIVLSFSFSESDINQFIYEPKPLFWMHLIYAYVLVAVILYLLVVTALKVALEYKMQYILPSVVIVVIVIANGTMNFLPFANEIDITNIYALLFSVVVIIWYWCCFIYPRKMMLRLFKTSIFDSLDQGIILFGYYDRMLLCNEKLKEFIPWIDFNENLTLKKFHDNFQIGMDMENMSDNQSFQWIREGADGSFNSFFCDYKRLKNAQGRDLGRILILEDARLDTDLNTGFHSWDSFNVYASESKFEVPAVITCCDINGLSVINNTYGRGKGDKLISELATIIREEFPVGTYFVRGTDANLIAISSRTKESDAVEIMERVRKRFTGTFQYANIVVNEEDPDMIDAIFRAEKNVATWKLLDNESMRSDTLNSLIRALKECDEDTEAHVRRTQYLGIKLSRRMQLTDTLEARLALLCVLHDIGKIGVPLEILNKPRKLSEDEWAIIKSHTNKGYEIAQCSTDYIDIADEILHHHERWDGKGYPDGLSKETIPILSRLISVIDAYDAMVSQRPYKRAMTVREAIQELVDNAGTQFDPAVVAEFVKLIEEEGLMDTSAAEIKPEISALNYKPSSAKEMTTSPVENDGVYDIRYIRYTLNSSQQIIEVDDGFEDFTGYSREDIDKLKLSQWDLVPERYRTMYSVRVNENVAKHQMAYLEHVMQRKDGKEKNVICLGRYYYDSATGSNKSEITVFDALDTKAVNHLISKEKQNSENRLEIWEEKFRKDSLTGLLSHSAFVNDVELKLLDRDIRTVLIMLDIDYFKKFNDTYGHRAGDNLLIALGGAIRSSLRDTDISGRLGGDEFAGAMFFHKDVSEDIIIARIKGTFESISSKLSAEKAKATFSMGAAISGDSKGTFAMLYDAVDAAMYSAKDTGRNRLTISDK